MNQFIGSVLVTFPVEGKPFTVCSHVQSILHNQSTKQIILVILVISRHNLGNRFKNILQITTGVGMRFSLFVFIFLQCLILSAKEIAISFDDIPRRHTGHFSRWERAQNLVKQLKEAKVPDPVFYCNSGNIEEETKRIVQLYNDSGFVIASHTHTHPDFNKLGFAEYSKDFLAADKDLSQYSRFVKLFRFPYLREGNEKSKRDKMRKLLKQKGYQNAYVTVDFNDWYVEDLLRDSIKKKEKVDLEKLKALYISLTKESLDHYDNLAKKYLGRSPKHVLLLHETDIAALFIKDLVTAMRSWGWKIISSKVAYTDEIAQFQLEQPLTYNPGRVGEIAMSKGHPKKDIWANSTNRHYIKARYENEVLVSNKKR